MQLLVAIEGATLCATMLSGWLKGVMAEIAASGSRVVKILRALPCGVRSQEKISPSRSEEHTSELQSLMRISYAVFCLNKKITRENLSAQAPREHYQPTNLLTTMNTHLYGAVAS